MFFSKKENNQTLEILQKKNIIIYTNTISKEDTIRLLGEKLVESGYVNASYIEAMIEREKTFATYMGNAIALPHGVERAKEGILSSGIAVMIAAHGIDWSGDTAKVIIAIAGKGEEHLEILGNIATKLGEEEAVQALLTMNIDEIHDFITRKED